MRTYSAFLQQSPQFGSILREGFNYKTTLMRYSPLLW
jgi:hypothetical protein